MQSVQKSVLQTKIGKVAIENLILENIAYFSDFFLNLLHFFRLLAPPCSSGKLKGKLSFRRGRGEGHASVKKVAFGRRRREWAEFSPGKVSRKAVCDGIGGKRIFTARGSCNAKDDLLGLS